MDDNIEWIKQQKALRGSVMNPVGEDLAHKMILDGSDDKIMKQERALRDSVMNPVGEDLAYKMTLDGSVDKIMKQERALRDSVMNPVNEIMKQEKVMMDAVRDPIADVMKQQQDFNQLLREQQQSLLGDNDMDYEKLLESIQKPAIEKYADRKRTIELLENIDETLKAILDELKSR